MMDLAVQKEQLVTVHLTNMEQQLVENTLVAAEQLNKSTAKMNAVPLGNHTVHHTKKMDLAVIHSVALRL